MRRKNVYLALLCASSVACMFSSIPLSAEEEVRPVSEFLKQREPHWRPKIVAHHQDGSPKVVLFYESDANERPVAVKQVSFHPGGQIASELDLVHIQESEPAFKDWKNTIVPHGLSVFYFPSGKIERVVHYDRGVLHGKMQVFYENGLVKAEGTFKQGVRQGKLISYFEGGEKLEESHYQDGKMVGELCRYYQNGMRMALVPYVEGVPHGNALEWFESGAMRASYRYSNGVLHSDGSNPAVILYNQDRAIIEVQDFRSGQPVGMHIKYHDNGKESYKCSFKEGKKIGKEQFFSSRKAFRRGGVLRRSSCWQTLEKL